MMAQQRQDELENRQEHNISWCNVRVQLYEVLTMADETKAEVAQTYDEVTILSLFNTIKGQRSETVLSTSTERIVCILTFAP